MKTKQRVLPALLAAMFLGAAAPSVQAQQFSGVYAFGDSLSDAGYYRPWLATLGLPPAVIATLGRFTTNPDPVFSEILSRRYGFTPAPSNVAGGNIYAQGGARVSLPSPLTPPGQAQRPVSTQIGEFLAANGSAADPNALYSVFVGANDFFVNLGAYQAGAITQAQLQANLIGTGGAAPSEIAQIARLAQSGARYIIVAGLPDIGSTPAFAAADAGTRAAVTQLSAGYNTTLFAGLVQAGVRVIPIDTFTFFSEMRANPAAFGFTNITSPACGLFPPITTPATGPSSQFCLSSNYVAAGANRTYLFADGVHPTGAAQAIFAQFVQGMIDGPIAYSTLAEVPLRTRASHVRTITDGLGTVGNGEGGRLSVFASADRGPFTIDTTGATAGLDSTNKSITAGVAMRASQSVIVGAAIGRSLNDGSFGNGLGGYSTRETVFSLFASAAWGGFYGTGVVSISDVDFQSVNRNIVLGPTTRQAAADTKGSNASAFFTAGYDFPVGRVMVGPTIAVATQNVEVNGFDESGAASSNLRIGAQKRRSEVWSAGVRASVNVAGWTPWVRATADRERRDDARFVTASPLSLPTGNSYELPAYAPGKSFTTGAIGIRGVVAERIGLSLAFYKVFGRSGIKEDGVSGMLSYRF
jgi:outer membrane lipase/esterase